MNSEFFTKDKICVLDAGIRDRIKPGWQEMLNPAKSRVIEPNPIAFSYGVEIAEKRLMAFGETLVGKRVLEAGCNEGARSYWMAKYQGTHVHGIDVDDYTADQSPDLNAWNPKDIAFVHNKFDEMRSEYAKLFPKDVSAKVTFETRGMEQFTTDKPYDVIVSWDTLEHIIDLPKAFNQMASSLKTGGIAYHDYNSFFSINGGHSLCTLDFYYGHCRLNPEDFERYVQDFRPLEHKAAMSFYRKCLNRATQKDIKELAEKSGFEILFMGGESSFSIPDEIIRGQLSEEILPEVANIYPNVTVEDLLKDSIHIILRKI